MIAFGGMVVDNIENYFQPRRVQCLDHGLELADRAVSQIARFERKKADRVISPVIAQTALNELAIINERMHWHKFDGSHAQTG